MDTPSAYTRRSITDSPWYWVYLFSTAGAIALVLAGPKFAARQSQIERNSEDRLHVARFVAKQQSTGSERESEPPTATHITLWPLYVVLGCGLSLAWFNLWRVHQRGRGKFEPTAAQNKATA